MSLPQLSCLNPYRYLMQKLFKETRSWATVLTTRLGVLNMHCRDGIAIPVPLHTCGLLANGIYTCLGQFVNIRYTVYHYTHLVGNLQLFSRFVCLLDSSCQYRVPNSIRHYCQCQACESYY